MTATNNIKSFFSDHQRFEMSCYAIEQCKEAIELLQAQIRQLTNADYQSYLGEGYPGFRAISDVYD